MVAIGRARGPGEDIAGAHGGFAIVLDQHRFACEHHQQFVEIGVPVPLARPGARLEHDVARAQMLEPAGRGEAAVAAAAHGRIERRGIARRIGLGDGIEIELGHRCALLLADTA